MTGKPSTLKVGDRVKWWTRTQWTSTAHRGVIVRVTPSGGCAVKPDGAEDETVFRSNSRDRPVILTQYDLDLEAWSRRRPRSTKFVSVERPFLSRGDGEFVVWVDAAKIGDATPDNLESIGDAMKAIAAWLRLKPVRPDDERYW